jgi:hypothetical protein
MGIINTHGLVCDFGKHNGELWTRIPVSYLKWLVNQPRRNPGDIKADIAASELKRRGTITPTIEVSGHAIDRASLMCRKTWHQTAINEEEGLHAWLCRMAVEAREKGTKLDSGKYRYQGMKFAYEEGELYPVLKTVHPA